MAELKFNYIKTNSYREIYINGVFGGITPDRKVQMSFFTERLPIPKEISYSLDQDGKLGKELTRDTREGIIRSVEVTTYLDLDAAKAIHQWLGEKIKTLNENVKR